jgi:hypothetical protein
MSVENNVPADKSRRTWGWVLVILGGIITLPGTFIGLLTMHDISHYGMHETYVLFAFFCTSLVMIGVVLLLLGMRLLILTGSRN